VADFIIRKAERTQVKSRTALIGPSGSGKTYSALRLARGLAPQGRVVLIDTEHGRSEYYATEFDFDVLRLDPPFSPERYIAAIEAAERSGAEVLIIDSASHEWNGLGGILRILDDMPGENSFGKWKKLTPRHDAFIDKLIRCKLHLIVGLRGKDEYVLEVNERGKQQPKKVGVGAQMRDGLEYEMTVAFLIDLEKHVATASKDNTHLFDGKFEVLTEAHGAALRAWCESGAAAQPQPVEPRKAEPEKPAAEPTNGNGKKADPVRSEWMAKIGAVVTGPLFSDADRELYRRTAKASATDALPALLDEVTGLPADRAATPAPAAGDGDELF
jgi:hypothetical protein